MVSDNIIEADKNAGVFAAGYLIAKKYIDDAALNAHVLQTLTRCLSSERDVKSLQVLEVGAGIGTMLSRLVEREVLKGPVVYWLTDNDATHLAAAKRYLTTWAKKHNNNLIWATGQDCRLVTGGADITIYLKELDILKIDERVELRGCYDLLLAHGVLDLFDFSQIMEGLFSCLKRDGLCYFTCNFDGETIFFPELPADQEIINLYHGSMERRRYGASHTGRRLLAYLHNQEAEILAAGSSDWLIHPSNHGTLPAQKVFLHTIVALVEKELAEKARNRPEFIKWIKVRRQQIEKATLCFLAKHLDILARPQCRKSEK